MILFTLRNDYISDVVEVRICFKLYTSVTISDCVVDGQDDEQDDGHDGGQNKEE